MRPARRSFLRGSALGVVGLATSGWPVLGQGSPAGANPSWIDPNLLAAARAEGGSITVYSSMNENEGIPLWKLFEERTGIRTDYIRGSDTQLIGRITIEARAQQRTWDVLVTTAVGRLPPEFLEPLNLSEAPNIGKAISPDRRWHGVYSNYNAPAYNTKLVKASDLPKTYEEFLDRKQWAGKIAIDGTDNQWLYGLYRHYGEARARKLVQDIIATLKPVVVDGHLALARSVGAGEYWVALNNYASLTINVKLGGAPTDFWALDPVSVFYGQVGVSARAPHPKSAQLAANFVISREGQQMLPRAGRMPVRADVQPNPPDAIATLEKKTVIPVQFTGEEERKWQKMFEELFKPR